METKIITQENLTDECWLVQFWGLKRCKTCEHKDTDCGGRNIRKTRRNKKGFTVPLE